MSTSAPHSPPACPTCGASLPSESTDGLCPRCLLGEAMQPGPSAMIGELAPASPSGTTPRTTGGSLRWTAPTLEELQPELPHYEILGLLGRGGMGAVYHARQKSLNREVAIKILPPLSEADDVMHFAERFKAEAHAMARLTHPGIIAVYDAGQTPGGLLFYVMELIQGTDVAQMIQAEGRLAPEQAHAIAANVCQALTYAHEHGIIHRDIKPANIMIDIEGRVKVADFGLAKMVNDNVGMTHTNIAVGTPDYVAPESLIPGMVVDARADLYAVGVMLYQMLTGQVPRGAWKPASEVAEVDPRFDAIISKAMQLDREARFATAMEMWQRLDALLEPAPPAPDLAGDGSTRMIDGGESQSSGAMILEERKRSRASMLIGLSATAIVGVAAVLLMGWKSGGAPRGGHNAGTGAPVLHAASDKGAAPVPNAAKTFEVEPAALPVVQQTSATPAPNVTQVPDPPSSAPPTPAPPTSPEIPAAAPSQPVPPAQPPAVAQPAPSPVPPAAPPRVSASPPPGPSQPLPAELAALDAQFIKLQKESVTAPFDAEVAKLNVGYAGGLDRAIAAETAAGHLDGILALETEKKQILEKQPVPESDDANTLKAIKDLRGIYRTAYAKLIANRTANLQALTGPLEGRLKQLETDLTRANRVADAKTVRAYREALIQGSADTLVRNDSKAGSQAGNTAVVDVDDSPRAPLNPAARLALKDGFTNSLGMKFVPVKGTEAYFCIHETRYKDYAVYAAETSGVDGTWKNQVHDDVIITQRAEDHPVTNVTWHDAKAFCDWLSKKEGKTYRLPSDREWSVAVGLGRTEKWQEKTTPSTVFKDTNELPWGTKWPPPKAGGNYLDESRKNSLPKGAWGFLEGYNDGFPTSAPVMSFAPNKSGLFDMGGNLWEWVDDWYDVEQKRRVLRGSSWGNESKAAAVSSCRIPREPETRYYHNGFRVVADVQ